MHRIVCLILVLMLNVLVVAGGNCQNTPLTPAEQYKALRKELNMAMGAGGPMTDAERMKFVGRAYNHHFVVAVKFLELAEKYPNDPIALDALLEAVWQVNGTPWPVEMVGQDTARPRAFAILQRDHVRSDKLGPLCQRISYGFCKEYEPFLRAVMAANPNKSIQATAYLSLGSFLNNRAQQVNLCRARPEFAREFADLYGKEYLAALLRQDRGKVMKEAEAVFRQAAEKYGEVKLPDGKTVAEQADVEISAIRNLSVGKQAPEIDGVDQDGRQFKLSDYRGKVVLLDFWSWV